MPQTNEFTSSQFVLSSLDFCLAFVDLHTTQLLLHLNYIIIFFFLEVEVLYTIYGNHTFTMVVLLHIGGVSKFYKWRNISLQRILERIFQFILAKNPRMHENTSVNMNIELRKTRQVNEKELGMTLVPSKEKQILLY